MEVLKIFQCPLCATVILISSTTKNIDIMFGDENMKWMEDYSLIERNGEMEIIHKECGEKLKEADYSKLGALTVIELLCAAKNLKGEGEYEIKKEAEAMDEAMYESGIEDAQISKTWYAYLIKSLEKYHEEAQVDTIIRNILLDEYLSLSITESKSTESAIKESANQKILDALNEAMYSYGAGVLSVDTNEMDRMVYINICNRHSSDIVSGPIACIDDVDRDALCHELDMCHVGHCL